MSWGTTHGWKTDKGFDPFDPDRDIVLEMECLSELEDQEFSEFINKQFGDDGIERDLGNVLLSNELGFPVEIEEKAEG